ncbi:hypothetical protein ACJX0J_010400 [Zea mays]
MKNLPYQKKKILTKMSIELRAWDSRAIESDGTVCKGWYWEEEYTMNLELSTFFGYTHVMNSLMVSLNTHVMNSLMVSLFHHEYLFRICFYILLLFVSEFDVFKPILIFDIMTTFLGSLNISEWEPIKLLLEKLDEMINFPELKMKIVAMIPPIIEVGDEDLQKMMIYEYGT